MTDRATGMFIGPKVVRKLLNYWCIRKFHHLPKSKDLGGTHKSKVQTPVESYLIFKIQY